MTPRTPHLLVGTLLVAAASAQSFTYNDFSNVSTLSLLGHSAQNGTVLRLTANVSDQTGVVWHRAKVPVISGFDTTFTFRITPPTAGTKAEGMAFVIHADPSGLSTFGGTVWGLGYGAGSNNAVGIRNSIAIELDTFQDGSLGDTSSNELSIHTRGGSGNHESEQFSIARATPATVLSDGQQHALRVRYVPGTIEVYVDNAATPTIARAYSLLTGGLYANGQPASSPALTSGMAWAGFCASTGAGSLTEQVEILSWTWTSSPINDPCYAGTLGEDVLFVEGSTGGLLRELDLATFQPLSIEMRAPAISGPGLPWVMIASLQPNPGAPGTSLGFGNMCMPVSPFGPTELIFADAFGIFGAPVAGGPLPFTIPVPPPAITFDLDVTLQSVVALQPGAASLGISNAIDLRFRRAPAPTIASVVPLSAAAGQPITVTGTQFLPGCTLAVNGVAVTPTTTTATQIVFPYPAGLPCGSTVSVTRLDGQSAASALNPTPTVTSTQLASGTAAGNQTFVVIGTGFTAGTTVTIGGAAATVQSMSASALVLRTPPGTPGLAVVVITTPGGCQVQTSYTYL
jgi:hypothetical protein